MEKLDQYFTPTWAAELMLARYFPGLTSADVFCEPSCGDGRFLMAVPKHVQAYGIEIDPAAALLARENSGRLVIAGDFLEVDLPIKPTAFIGNPPFQMDIVKGFLKKCYEHLEYGGQVGFLLPVYMFQTAKTVMELNKRWSISQEMVTRNIFAGIKPLLFATFTKEQQTSLTGFFLYAETAALDALKKEYREMFRGNNCRANVWKETVYAALKYLGGKASLQELYACIENNKPTKNKFWREKIRQIAAEIAHRVEPGVFQLAA